MVCDGTFTTSCYEVVTLFRQPLLLLLHGYETKVCSRIGSISLGHGFGSRAKTDARVAITASGNRQFAESYYGIFP